MLRPRRRAIAGATLAVSLLGSAAWAQPAPPAGAPPPVPNAGASNAEAEARAHFKRATDHFDKQEWREALGEYRQSLAFKKTRGAMASAASCLKALGLYDEALDQYEELRREFPELPPKLEAKVAPAIAELQGLVGTLTVSGDAPAGASMFVDGRLRGKLPLPGPLRLGVGDHSIRVEKDGFEAITGKVVIKSREQATVQLAAASRKGLLRVSEKHGWALAVELDGKQVGKTPWEGLVEVGDHTVHLQGSVGVDDLAACGASGVGSGGEQAEMGSGPPATAIVKLYDVTSVALEAKEVDGSLEIDATPKDARIAVDGKDVGRGRWMGRLRLGEHLVEITAPGFLPEERHVRIERRRQRELQVALESDPAARLRAATIGAWVGYGVGVLGLGVFAVTGSLALVKTSEIKSRCGGTSCPLDEQPNLDTAGTLARISTGALVMSGIGVATGTLAVVMRRSLGARSRVAGQPLPTSGVVWSAGVGLGGFEIGGRF